MSAVTNNIKLREVINQVVNDPEYREVSSVPVFSSYQMGLLALVFLLVFGGIYLAYVGYSIWLLYPFMIFGFYSSFTLLHDATHRSVSSNKKLNDLCGTLSGNLLFPFVSTTFYRYFHLAHHRYVGDKDLDPDEAMVTIPAKYYPIGYLALFAYEYFIFRWFFMKVWHRTPSKLKIIIVTSLALNIGFNVFMFMGPYSQEYLFWFFIPNRLGAALTVYLFSHLPHPEGVPWDSYPFQSTYTLTGNKFVLSSLWGQDNHAMHHFLPHVSWYKYHKVWGLANGVFKKQFIPEREVFSRPDTDFKTSILTKEAVDNGDKTLMAKVSSVTDEAIGIKSYVFEPADGKDFPAFTAGSHINLFLPSGKVRSYSLVNPSFERNRYQIAVKCEPEGRGGSLEVHNTLQPGTQIEISTPKNNFVLYENAKRYILISGGIGITPLISMAHQLMELEKHFEFFVCGRSEEHIPFRFQLQNLDFAPNTEIHIDKDGKNTLDLSNILSKPDPDTLIYVCGPAGFNKWVADTGLQYDWEKDQIKQEAFSGAASSKTFSKAFDIVLQKSQKTLTVPKELTIVDTLLMNNIHVEYSCLQGTCGACIANVIEGEVDHRDAVLSTEEQEGCGQICLCVSRAKNESIVLDL